MTSSRHLHSKPSTTGLWPPTAVCVTVCVSNRNCAKLAEIIIIIFFLNKGAPLDTCKHTHTAVSVTVLEKSAQTARKRNRLQKKTCQQKKENNTLPWLGPEFRGAIDFALVSRRTEAQPPLSLIIPSSSSPKVWLFYIFLMWVECSYTAAPNSLCGSYVCAAKSKVKCLCRSK